VIAYLDVYSMNIQSWP